MSAKHLPIVLLVLVLALLAGCAADTTEEEPTVEPENVMGRADQLLPVDGTTDGYPSAPLEVAGAVIHLAYDDEFIYVHLEAEVEGWIAVGFNQRGGGMNGANMIIGYLSENGTPAFRDDVGRGHAHSEAGVSAVDSFYLTRSAGKTVFEFSYPVVFPSGENYNVEEIIPGETYSLIVAMHRSSDNIGTQHSVRGSVNFQAQP